MIEIYPNVWVGDQNATILSYNEDPFENEWYVLHCCKEPYHRQFVGYISRGAPKDHPEYLFARRGNRMALNMVDAPKPEFFSPDMIKAGLDFLEEGYKAGKKLLIHCNQGESRGPSVAMLFVYRRILHNEDAALSLTFAEAEAEMRKIYPVYNPGEGIRAHLQQCWGEY